MGKGGDEVGGWRERKVGGECKADRENVHAPESSESRAARGRALPHPGSARGGGESRRAADLASKIRLRQPIPRGPRGQGFPSRRRRRGIQRGTRVQ